MENFIAIKAEPRSLVGKGIAKKIRKEGSIPAVIYGGKDQTLAISVSLKEIKKIMENKNE